jgi:hypothetical protein
MDAIEHEGTVIRHIDFEAILEIFFWDLDFTIPLEELSALGSGGRDMMGIHDQVFNSAAGFVPHPDELAPRCRIPNGPRRKRFSRQNLQPSPPCLQNHRKS